MARGLIGVYKDYYHTADASISIIEKEVYYEMAMRFYAKTNNTINQLDAIREDNKIRFDESELRNFIRNIGSEAKKEDFRFDLLRWSKKEPYWCVFVCECGETGVSGIGGHFCIGKDENVHIVLSELIDSGWNVEIHQDYFNNM